MGPTWGPPGSFRPQMGPKCWTHEPCYQGCSGKKKRSLCIWIYQRAIIQEHPLCGFISLRTPQVHNSRLCDHFSPSPGRAPLNDSLFYRHCYVYTNFTNPRMHLFHIPQYSIQNEKTDCATIAIWWPKWLWKSNDTYNLCDNDPFSIGIYRISMYAKLSVSAHMQLILSRPLTGARWL